jgi:hypothetical protein
MNGKVRKTATYAQNDSLNPVTQTINYYRVENDQLQNRISNKVDVIDSANGVITKGAEMGKDVEIMIDLREQLSVTSSSSKQINLLLQKLSPPANILPINALLWYNKSEINRYRSAAVTKVISQFGILDSVVVIDKGSKVTTRNLVYDSETGDVVLTRTNNEFDDAVYNFNYPAHWAYSGMSSAYKNIQKKLTAQNILFGTLKDRSTENLFESGDEIIITEFEPKVKLDGTIVTGEYTSKTRKIWAIDASKGIENHKGVYFIDRNGNAVTTPNNELTTMLIVRSGKRNMLSAGVGNITAMANPIRIVNNVNRIVFDTASHVIAASAGVYKDLWRVDSTVSPVDTCYKVLDSATVLLPMKQALFLKKFNKNGHETDLGSQPDLVTISAGMQHLKRGGWKKGQTNALYTKTILDFDFNKIPKDATILSAKLSLTAMPFRGSIPTVSGALPDVWNYTSSDPTGFATSNTHAHYNQLVSNASSGNGVNLKRVTGNWKSTTTYSEIFTSPSTSPGSVVIPSTSGLASCDDLNSFECKNLLQEIVSSEEKTYGIQMNLLSSNVNESGSSRENERRSRSYYQESASI